MTASQTDGSLNHETRSDSTRPENALANEFGTPCRTQNGYVVNRGTSPDDALGSAWLRGNISRTFRHVDRANLRARLIVALVRASWRRPRNQVSPGRHLFKFVRLPVRNFGRPLSKFEPLTDCIPARHCPSCWTSWQFRETGDRPDQCATTRGSDVETQPRAADSKGVDR